MMRCYAAACGAALLSLTNPANATPTPPEHSYAIVIGFNSARARGEVEASPLRYADDDAIAFYEFVAPISKQSYLLTVVDSETSRRIGSALPELRPPSLFELRSAVARIRQLLLDDRAGHVSSTVYFYYGGHGFTPEGREPELELQDAPLTRTLLYDEVLDQLPADHVHLMIDACHAESVVRPRDLDARSVAISDDDRASLATSATLARFPNVGAVMAASRDARTHEWDAYLGGVFTHELLSGLRGAADVNGDARIEYSELAAFLAAANRDVRDPRARLTPVTHAPTADPHATIVDLRSAANAFRLTVYGADSVVAQVEDDRGNRLADVHTERRFKVTLRLPPNRKIFVRSTALEAEIFALAGTEVAFSELPLRATSSRARGELELSLAHGLFATPFGPSYYRGFVDRQNDLVPVSIPDTDFVAPIPPDRDRAGSSNAQPMATWAMLGLAGALTAGAATFALVARQDKIDFDHTSIESEGVSDSNRFSRDTEIAAVFAGGAAISAAAAAYLFLSSRKSPRLGATVSGLVVQF